MARSFEPYHRLRRRIERWDQDDRFGPLHELRRRLYRSPRGKLLGVFRGIAESMGFNVRVTRIIGVLMLLTLTDFFGAHGIMVKVLVAGFFYLLAALLMQAPRPAGLTPIPVSGDGRHDDASPPPVPQARYTDARPYPTSIRARVDLAQLDQQLDRLNHRIQRMEGIVTDRQFDWERRMES